MTDEVESQGGEGISRRTVLRRSALLGGALVWTAPAVQTLAGPAFAAQGSVCGGAVIIEVSANTCLLIATLVFEEGCCDGTLSMDYCVDNQIYTPVVPPQPANCP